MGEASHPSFHSIITTAARTMLIVNMIIVIPSGSTILIKDIVLLSDSSTENRENGV